MQAAKRHKHSADNHQKAKDYTRGAHQAAPSVSKAAVETKPMPKPSSACDDTSLLHALADVAHADGRTSESDAFKQAAVLAAHAPEICHLKASHAKDVLAMKGKIAEMNAERTKVLEENAMLSGQLCALQVSSMSPE